jgi:hypothetical protein
VTVFAIDFAIYSLAITWLYARDHDKTDDAEWRAKDAERDSAHWQAVAAGHPSADPHAFGRHAAYLVLDDDLHKNRSGK